MRKEKPKFLTVKQYNRNQIRMETDREPRKVQAKRAEKEEREEA